MLEIINNLMNRGDDYTDVTSEDILNKIEELGMLPPGVFTPTHNFNGVTHVMPDPKNPNEYTGAIKINQWEDEDEV